LTFKKNKKLTLTGVLKSDSDPWLNRDVEIHAIKVYFSPASGRACARVPAPEEPLSLPLV
ncbi:unnamed protein product, partial [Brassica rapa subsp. trilocularis]